MELIGLGIVFLIWGLTIYAAQTLRVVSHFEANTFNFGLAMNRTILGVLLILLGNSGILDAVLKF